MTRAPRQDAARTDQAMEGTAQSPAMTARVMVWMFVAGGLLSLSVGVFPRPEEANEPGFYAVGAASLLCGLFVRLYKPERHGGVLTVLAAIGTVLISLGVVFSPEGGGGPASDIEVLYLWPALFAAYCLTRRGQVALVAWTVLCYSVVLAMTAPPEMFATRLVQTGGSVGGVVFLVAVLRTRVDQLVIRLSDAARTDPLTGLRNRRGFEEEIAKELYRARRSGGAVAVVMGDLDLFKRLNDRYGHAAGDAALERVGRALSSGKRQIDTVARTGGEEFAVLLPDTDKRAAYVVAERLRSAIEKEFSCAEMPLTMSFGVAAFPDHAQSPHELLTTADSALYAAKRLGRNRSVIFSDQIGAVIGSEGDSSAAGAVHLTTLVSLAEALDLRDNGTSDHSETVGRLSAMTARRLGLGPERVERVRIAGVLHDIGKVGVPDSVLRKAGPLTGEEWAEMRRHPEIGAHILGNPIFDDVRAWVLAHHERPDGKGYPSALRSSDIPLEARILAVADAYEAMTADRVYRAAMGHDAARTELRRAAGSQFDAEVVDAFLAGLSEAATMKPTQARNLVEI